jgi:hypothetical protein
MAPKLRDRPHWIVLRGGLTLLVAGGVLAIPLQIWGALTSDSLSWKGNVGYLTDLPRGLVTPKPGAFFTFDGSVGVSLDDPSSRLSLLSVAPGIVLAATIAYVAWVLLLVVLNVNAGQPFYGAVPRLLTTVAPVIAVAAVAVTYVSAYANREIMLAVLAPGEHRISSPDQLFNPAYGRMIAWLFVALLMAVFARAFIEGRRLADDTRGLV